jgi:hypothetical protein
VDSINTPADIRTTIGAYRSVIGRVPLIGEMNQR